MRAARGQQGCASVPEVMPAYVWQLSTAEHRLEVAVNYVLRVEGVPMRVVNTSPLSAHKLRP
jgi:hypothetical protein